MRIVILGLSITSSWGNGHASTYRGLVRELKLAGHKVLFLEREMPGYAANRDMPVLPEGEIKLYIDLFELNQKYSREIQTADAVIVGSYVPDGVQVGQWVLDVAEGVTAFYDIDTPVTLAKLGRGDYEYLTPELIQQYSLYLSFTGGPVLKHLERDWGAPMARALYCSVDTTLYYKEQVTPAYDLGYMGTYSEDRQAILDRLLLEPARRWREGKFVVAGPQYPPSVRWPDNVKHVDHLPPSSHRTFYNRQRFTLNVTREDMVRAGYSPSVRLFEAAACATPVISDYWDGLDSIFKIGEEILISERSEDTMNILRYMSDARRRDLGLRAWYRVLSSHSARHRARELVGYLDEARLLIRRQGGQIAS
jgi:spore maturation protein CgeB